MRNKMSNGNETKNPRIIEARRLRKNGATDNDLIAAGFTDNEIARAPLLYSSSYKRCKTCGCKAKVDRDQICMGCDMLARMQRESQNPRQPAKPLSEEKVDKAFMDFDHPAILKSKN